MDKVEMSSDSPTPMVLCLTGTFFVIPCTCWLVSTMIAEKRRCTGLILSLGIFKDQTTMVRLWKLSQAVSLTHKVGDF